MHDDVFRPNLPLDPFHDLTQWSVQQPTLDHLLLCAAHRPHVVLILGEPPQTDLLPLASSPILASSLLLIATHAPPPLPHAPTGPAVRILRLPAPLSVQDSGALRLVSVFERADRVARAWRNDSAPPPIVQLAEASPNGDFTVQEEYFYSSSPPPTAIPRRRGTSNNNSSSTSSNSSVRSNSSTNTPKRPHYLKRSSSYKPSPIPHSSPYQRPFDAILNFLPHGLPEKSLLKNAILVTTLSAPFLCSPSPGASLPPPSYTPPTNKRASVFSTFSTSSLNADDSRVKKRGSTYPLPDAFQHVTGKPKLVHVLPVVARPSPAAPSYRSSSYNSARPYPYQPFHPPTQNYNTKPKLVQGIEQFLLSFAYPLPSLSSSIAGPRPTSIHMAMNMNRGHSSSIEKKPSSKPLPKPVPYILNPGVLGYELPCATAYTVAELIIIGAFDPPDDGVGAGRAWIASGEDVYVVGGEDEKNRLTTTTTTSPESESSESSVRDEEDGESEATEVEVEEKNVDKDAGHEAGHPPLTQPAPHVQPSPQPSSEEEGKHIAHPPSPQTAPQVQPPQPQSHQYHYRTQQSQSRPQSPASPISTYSSLNTSTMHALDYSPPRPPPASLPTTATHHKTPAPPPIALSRYQQQENGSGSRSRVSSFFGVGGDENPKGSISTPALVQAQNKKSKPARSGFRRFWSWSVKAA